MLLTTTSAKIEILLSANVTTTQWPIVAGWSDNTTSSYTPGALTSSSNNTTAVTVVSSPASSTQRIIHYMNIVNKDTNTNTITIRYNDGTNTFILHKITLNPNDCIAYNNKSGWMVRDAAGIERVLTTVFTQQGPVIEMPPMCLGPLTTVSITSTSTKAVYLGRMRRSFNRVKLRFEVTTLASTITWAEAAIASGSPSLGSAVNLTTLSYLPVDTVVNTTGVKTITFPVSGPPGIDLWFMYGNQATTVAVLRAITPDVFVGGLFQTATARPSTMAADTAFAVESASIGGILANFQLWT